MSHISGQVKGLLSKITSVDQGNYPEMMGKTFIINAPGMFKIVWGIVKRFLDARTLTKIEVSPVAYPLPSVEVHQIFLRETLLMFRQYAFKILQMDERKDSYLHG